MHCDIKNGDNSESKKREISVSHFAVHRKHYCPGKIFTKVLSHLSDSVWSPHVLLHADISSDVTCDVD